MRPRDTFNFRNPSYLTFTGCTILKFCFVDIDECADPNTNPCNGTCTNLPGSFNCSCPHGYEGDGTKNGSGCRARNSKSPALKLSLGEETYTFMIIKL